MELTELSYYERWGLGPQALERLRLLGDLLLHAGFNVTGMKDSAEIERIHFLDSLALLGVRGVRSAARIADVGSGGGLPALVLAVALPGSVVVAIESQHKKCGFIEHATRELALQNVEVACARAEEYGRGQGRSAHDLVVSRAVASLAVVAEYSLPLLHVEGRMVAMKGSISAEERIQAQTALGILGAGGLEAVRLEPFPGAENRWVYVADKIATTPEQYPRRPGVPTKRPLGVDTKPKEAF
jgi:16S rRNA (guanine527-N7)-methyltransferase